MLVSLVNDDWHLVREGPRVVEELFRYRLDPAETTNLMGSIDGTAALPGMRQTIVRALVSDAPDTAYAAARARARSGHARAWRGCTT